MDVTQLKVRHNIYARGKSRSSKAKKGAVTRAQGIHRVRSFPLGQFREVQVNTVTNMNQNSQPDKGRVAQPEIPKSSPLAPMPSMGNLMSYPTLPDSSASFTSNPIVPSLPNQPLKPRAPLGWDIANPDPEQEPEPEIGH